MKRRLLNLLTALSLLYGVLVTANLCFGGGHRTTKSASGVVLQRYGAMHLGHWDGGPIEEDWQLLGFRYVRFRSAWGSGMSSLVTIPHWPFILGLFALPLFRLRLLLRDRRSLRRRQFGLCPSCGYDLRATPGKCPECGESSARGTIPAA